MMKIIGLGNALVDLIINIENDMLLDELGLPKGSMTLIDEKKAAFILEKTKHLHYQVAAGGSASNTMDGLASLGLPCGYIGKIGHDPYGELFKNEMLSKRIDPVLLYGDIRTGTAITLLSTDAERTFGTYLGAAVQMTENEIKSSYFKEYDYLHIEGYLVQNHSLILKAMTLAKKQGLKISIDMASYNTVEANKDFLVDLINNYVDIVFANEEEAKSLTGKHPEEALHEISFWCDIAIVKTGKDGSWIRRKDHIVKVDAIHAVLKDTTGAGDLYAAGFLYGLANNLPLDKCGKIGSLLGGKTVEIYGARLIPEQWVEIKKIIHDIGQAKN